MFIFFRTFLIIILFVFFSSKAFSESSWITKKSDKSKKTLIKEKEAESIDVGKWIKKKIKKNKKKFKEKKKENKNWITKKKKNQTKEQKKENKKILKAYLDINDMPEAEFYFAAIVLPNSEEKNPKYFYGYANSDKNSETFKFNNSSYYSISSGYGYSSDGKTTCELHAKIGPSFSKMKGEVDLSCTNGSGFTGDITRKDDSNGGYGDGETKIGNEVLFKFHTSKNDAVAQYLGYKEQPNLFARGAPSTSKKTNISIKIKPTGKYYALIIANSRYDDEYWDDLKSPSKDAKAIAAVLEKKYKFEKVWLTEDATRIELFSEIDKLKTVVTDKDYLLIYYSGHGDKVGEEINAEAYWVPIDGTKKSYTWVNTNEVKNSLTEIKAKHILVMIDSCFGGLFQKKGFNKNSDKELDAAEIIEAYEKNARLVLTSGGNQPVSDSSIENGHSLFAAEFLRLLNNNTSNLTSFNIFTKIKRIHAKKGQSPQWDEINILGTQLVHLDGDFVFHVPN